MVSRREWYRRTAATWPAIVPPLTAEEAVRAGRKLFRFVFKRKINQPVVATSGNRYSGYGYDAKGRGALKVNHERGWRDLVHELSHTWGGGHSKDHAKLEARMIREVLKRGWLNGALRRAPKPAPAPADKHAVKILRLKARLVGWERRERRAHNAVMKLRRQLRRAENKRPAEAGPRVLGDGGDGPRVPL